MHWGRPQRRHDISQYFKTPTVFVYPNVALAGEKWGRGGHLACMGPQGLVFRRALATWRRPPASTHVVGRNAGVVNVPH
ncbi:uncharacterized protein CANTADRAFT_312365 [Suhomyces tanzawaensis NRRL Y-17324]|uniref:Uncharacterized protein n=1 Tax=Suhomyces tanzawaensis NRRL Y-17324 TaxID=984487 RepID=A0A1E4SDE2_9ASCO|nr:uncharacterized protein CANTADRAFT_312365 [Suhomyces tanzawaensis NRRL Y-17324]ODV77488.1 hypothetical protein CANTADRAFT_312365 [Suhomyces tanzawaensis NRRL Y-17324]